MAVAYESHTETFGAGPTLVGNRPTGLTSGELLIAVAAPSTGENAAPELVTSAPSGFVKIVDSIGGASSRSAISAYYKIAGGSEPTTYSFDLASAVNNSLHLIRFSGADATTPIDVSATATGGSEECPSITTTVANTLALWLMADQRGNAGTPVRPSGTTLIDNYEEGGGSAADGMAVGIAYEAIASAGATGTRLWTSMTGTGYASISLAIRPSAGGGGWVTKPVKYWTGSAWTEKPTKYWTGSAWVEKPVKVWTG